MNFYDIRVLKRENRQDLEVPMAEYQGKVLLIVNTATACGLTPQYEALEKLYRKYRDQGFEILDFPCNQFMEQAKGNDEEIALFCTAKYDNAPKSLAGRFWRWHINFCPGWKGYMASLSEEEREEMRQKYNLK